MSVFAVVPTRGYSATMTKETKTARVNVTLKPLIRKKLEECAEALEMSQAEVVAEAIARLHRAKDVQQLINAREQN